MHKGIYRILIILLLIFLMGIAGYMIIEKWSFIDSMYMTVITLTTVGFMEVNILSSGGRIFTILLIILGFSVIFYGLGTVTVFIVEGEMMGILRRKRMRKKISKLDQHYIICGLGDMGIHVVNEFAKTKKQFVLIEKNEAEIKMLHHRYSDLLYVTGDASSDVILDSAGIKAAKGLITTFASDKENLFVVLTAKSLNSNLRIVTRCIEQESEHKLQTAGANAIVSANSIGGMRMASEMLRPTVVSFLDVMLRGKDEGVRVEEAVIGEQSRINGLTIKDANIFKSIGLIIIAVKDASTGQNIYNPPSSLELKTNDALIVLGRVDQINRLKECVNS